MASSDARPRSKSFTTRSEEHTSELQSRLHLVCRLLLEKKKKKLQKRKTNTTTKNNNLPITQSYSMLTTLRTTVLCVSSLTEHLPAATQTVHNMIARPS